MQVTAPLLQIPSIPYISFSWIVHTPFLLIILGVFFVFYSIITSVLLYHWSMYGMHGSSILVARTLFLFVSFLLFLSAGMSLIYF